MYERVTASAARRLTRDGAVLVVVDIQEKFIPTIFEMDRVIANTVKLVQACHILKVPVVVTEQYPKGLGRTVKQIAETFTDFRPIEKMAFSGFGETGLREELSRFKATKLIVTGIEAHVCVTQTVLDALRNDYTVHVIRDAISSRSIEDWKTAVYRMRLAGAVISTTEMAVFELLETAGSPEFKEILKIVK